jgi:hypothetical protein
MEEDHGHSAAGGGGGGGAGAPGAAALAPHSGAGAAGAPPPRLDAIPTRGYAMPPPAFRVKREFATWDIDHTRFEVKKVLGKGSYGVVVEAFDHLTKKRVAIKKINTIFDVFENSKRIYREVRGGGGEKRTGRAGAVVAVGGRVRPHSPQRPRKPLHPITPRRFPSPHPPHTHSHPTTPPLPPPLAPRPPQVRILRALQHPYIVKLLHVSCPGINDATVDLLSFQDLYIVFECVDTDLAKLIKDETQQLTEQHIRCVPEGEGVLLPAALFNPARWRTLPPPSAHTSPHPPPPHAPHLGPSPFFILTAPLGAAGSSTSSW